MIKQVVYKLGHKLGNLSCLQCSLCRVCTSTYVTFYPQHHLKAQLRIQTEQQKSNESLSAQ